MIKNSKASWIKPDINILPHDETMTKLLNNSFKSMQKYRRKKLYQCQECMAEKEIEHMVRRGTGYVCRSCM
jgi:predicted SprT family Zn-dependent metalloprotease